MKHLRSSRDADSGAPPSGKLWGTTWTLTGLFHHPQLQQLRRSNRIQIRFLESAQSSQGNLAKVCPAYVRLLLSYCRCSRTPRARAPKSAELRSLLHSSQCDMDLGLNEGLLYPDFGLDQGGA